MEGARVRRLEERDIDVAIALTDLEGWGYTREDFARLRSLSPEGCFVAEHGGEVVGVLTTTSYDGLAFLGAVIVRPELRGQGVGKAMMDAALAHLRASGVTTVRLNAYLNAVPFYEKLGFHGEYEVIRWHGSAKAGRHRGVRPIRKDDLGPLSRLDTRAFGADRTALLERLAEEFSESFLVYERKGDPLGYIVGSVSGEGCEIGPWIATPHDGSVAGNLFDELIAATGATSIAFSGPSRNEALAAFVREIRMEEVFRALRMYWGKDAFGGDPTRVWALGGLEKG